MTDDAICPCQVTPHPLVIDNPPGRSVIRYRVGDYSSFREALLQGLPGEVDLRGWRPTATGDLALQLLEWWAYLADILTFYDEQIANGAYLGTAFLPGSVEQLVRLIGYRPRPGIGAEGTLAALVSGQPTAQGTVQLPVGFAVQSKPGPGEQPKVFEVSDAAVSVLPSAAGGVVPIDVVQNTQIHGRTSLRVRGAVTGVKAGDVVVVSASPVSSTTSQAMTVAAVRRETDSRGRVATRLVFTGAIGLTGHVTDFQVMRSDTSLPIYPYAPAETAIPATPIFIEFAEAELGVAISATAAPAFEAQAVSAQAGPAASIGGSVFGPLPFEQRIIIHLASLARSVAAGDLVVLEMSSSGALSFTPAVVTASTEVIWYANAADTANAPDKPPTGDNVVPLSLPHAVLTLDTEISLATARVRFGFRSVGDVLDEPVGSTVSGPTLTCIALSALAPGAHLGQAVLIEDATGAGAAATLAAAPSIDPVSGDTIVTVSTSATGLVAPLRLLFNLVEVTEGKTVSGEALGSGDPTVAGQSFVLQKSPLTYLAGNDPSFPTSTLIVRVDSIAWTEVPSFYGQPPDARVFVTSQDADQKTHVAFGDGVHGARLPRGTSNVVATYRVGSGKPPPAAGTLVTILKPVPGLTSVRNPVVMTGSDDPTPPAKIRQVAPRSVLTFGRAISASDYEAIAASAPSVTRARAHFSWDPQRQRATVVVYVGDDDGAAAAAQHAIDAARDPNVPVTVQLAKAVHIALTFTLAHDAAFDPDVIGAQVMTALVGDAGLLSPGRIRIGDALYDSQIYAACLAVPGTIAVRNLVIANATTGALLAGVRHAPGEGKFFTAGTADIHLTLEAE